MVSTTRPNALDRTGGPFARKIDLSMQTLMHQDNEGSMAPTAQNYRAFVTPTTSLQQRHPEGVQPFSQG